MIKIITLTLTAILLFFVHKETGLWTTVTFVLIFIVLEINNQAFKRMMK